MGDCMRVLQVITGLGSGGAESFLMSMYRNMDHQKVQFDFLVRSRENFYKEELERSGSKVYYTTPFPPHYLKNLFEVSKILRENNYSVVHVHANALLYMTALEEAKRLGIPCRIMHSHSSSTCSKKYLPIHFFNKKRIEKLATHKFACSELAGKWMFNGGFQVINNAIDLERFRYSEESRNCVRNELGISANTFVMGHVGRFWQVKNHSFLLDIFAEIVKTKPASMLVLVGTGDLVEAVQQKASSLGIEDKVLLLGERKDVNKILSALDAFVFPSLCEGLPIAAIEAQANGLFFVCSENVTGEVIIADNAYRLPLEKGPEYWAKYILSADLSRYDNTKAIQAAGYDIRVEANKLQEFYLSQVKA